MHGGITECEHEKRALGVEPVKNNLFRLAMCTLFQGQQRLPLVWCWYQCETTELAPWYQDPAPQSWHKRHLSSTVCCPPNPLQCHLQIESTAKIRLKFDGLYPVSTCKSHKLYMYPPHINSATLCMHYTYAVQVRRWYMHSQGGPCLSHLLVGPPKVHGFCVCWLH